MNGVLVLEDGHVFQGELFGHVHDVAGEVVFSTGMSGYEEVITDPSYFGQIVTLTYPLIGNYGINLEDVQSSGPKVSGLVIRELCRKHSHWQARESLDAYLTRHRIAGIQGIDTRAVTRVLRGNGTMRGVIARASDDVAKLRRRSVEWSCGDLVAGVTSAEPWTVDGPGPHVAVLDLGAKKYITDQLSLMGCRITILPAQATPTDVAAHKPDGVLLSNGPGDPRVLGPVIECAAELAATYPTFGICLGHQVMALGMGADCYKLPYGHRGFNHPVRDLATGRVTITSQNHGYALDETTLERAGFEVTHRNLNDNTVEGIRHRQLRAFSVQFHPEGGPGPLDSAGQFGLFLNLMRG